jgi:hypothetical protein
VVCILFSCVYYSAFLGKKPFSSLKFSIAPIEKINRKTLDTPQFYVIKLAPQNEKQKFSFWVGNKSIKIIPLCLLRSKSRGRHDVPASTIF